MVDAGGSAGPTDLELVAVVREGSPSESSRAAHELFGRYRHRVYGWCRRYVRDHEQALDLTQDVLMTAFRSLHTYQGRAPFGGWLFTVTHHACLRAVGRRRLDVEGQALLDLLPDPRPDAQTVLEDEQARDELLDLLRTTLDPVEQRALWLRCFENMAVDDITGLLGIEKPSGARGVLQNARRKLRIALERKGVRE